MEAGDEVERVEVHDRVPVRPRHGEEAAARVRAQGRRSASAAPLPQGFRRLPCCHFDSLLTRSRGGKIIPPWSQARNARYPPFVSRENFMDRANETVRVPTFPSAFVVGEGSF